MTWASGAASRCGVPAKPSAMLSLYKVHAQARLCLLELNACRSRAYMVPFSVSAMAFLSIAAAHAGQSRLPQAICVTGEAVRQGVHGGFRNAGLGRRGALGPAVLSHAGGSSQAPECSCCGCPSCTGRRADWGPQLRPLAPGRCCRSGMRLFVRLFYLVIATDNKAGVCNSVVLCNLYAKLVACQKYCFACVDSCIFLMEDVSVCVRQH